jgi:SpoVK/Ycf46/Vps4 family AAA+-type ATPase
VKALRLPAWLESSVLARYQAGASHLFLLHGNVRDLQPIGPDYLPLPDGLKRLCARRDVLALYDVSSGLTFGSPLQEKAFRKALGLKAGPLPSDPARALVLLDALVSTERLEPGRVAVVIDYAHALAPSGPSSSVERTAITTLARWAAEPKIAARRPLVFLLAPAAGDVSGEIFASAQAAEIVEVGKPEIETRADFARVLRGRFPEVTFGLTPEELAAETGGLSLVQMEDILQRARGSRAPLVRDQVVERKIDLLKQEYSDVLEILNPRYDLSAVGGLEHAVGELREVAAIMKKGQTSAAPMGIVLMGPPGTGKSYLAECFAKECGMLCVRFRPLRQMYVGQSERNQERAFAAIRALAPVVVLVDESDQAEGGSRDQGSGDSGVTERMRGAAFGFWGDGSLRGKVLRIDITNRIDLIDSAMRRSGRTDVKIPILMPDEQARAQIFQVSVRKHRLATSIADFAPFAKRTAGFTGSDIELCVTTAWRFALRDGKTAVDEAALQAALDDLLPTARDQAAIDRMTLLALDECRNKRLLPRNHEQIRREIEARSGAGG